MSSSIAISKEATCSRSELRRIKNTTFGSEMIVTQGGTCCGLCLGLETRELLQARLK
jgi:hypothetical protein